MPSHWAKVKEVVARPIFSWPGTDLLRTRGKKKRTMSHVFLGASPSSHVGREPRASYPLEPRIVFSRDSSLKLMSQVGPGRPGWNPRLAANVSAFHCVILPRKPNAVLRGMASPMPEQEERSISGDLSHGHACRVRCRSDPYRTLSTVYMDYPAGVQCPNLQGR